ncbi:MAG: GNAT family N-acetyltransferase [Solirubrobacteraceae bacterium]
MIWPVRLVITRDIDRYAEAVADFLAQRMERNVMASILANLRSGESFGSDAPLLACRLDPHDRILAVAIRTPPWPLIATEFGDHTAAVKLMRAWLVEDPLVVGVNAETDTARAIAAAWTELTGGSTRRRMNEAMHALSAVREPPRPAQGALRAAGEVDRGLLVEWERAFMAEAGVGIPQQAPRIVDRRLATGAQFIWEHGEPVSSVAVSAAIAGTVRIGPVYTPVERRRHGYATSAVAAVSKRVLASNASRCMLFTDLTNPTSNKIYASLGYRRFAGWEEQMFTLPRAARHAGENPAKLTH